MSSLAPSAVMVPLGCSCAQVGRREGSVYTFLHLASLSSSASVSTSMSCLNVTYPPFLQVKAWSTEFFFPQAQCLQTSGIGQL